MKTTICLTRALVASLVLAGCVASRIPIPDGGATPDVPLVSIDTGPVLRPDAPTGCMTGYLDCAGTCTRVATDNRNCGACGVVCPPGSSCAIGLCDCLAPLLACNGVCLDPDTSEEHCGTCGNACEATEVCSMGECIVMCEGAGRGICVVTPPGGEPTQICADFNADPLNCGTCGTRCAGGTTCVSGLCTCPGAQMSCGGGCVDLMTDVDNCGSCLATCGAGGTCAGGRCTTCGGGLDLCGTPPRCVDTDTSRLHCGMCSRGCGAGEACAGGLCVCSGALVDCGTGCTSLETNPLHCGVCGNGCGPGGVCSAGTCTCAAGLMMCGTSCHDLNTDIAHCGACDAPCPALVGGICSGGVCGCPPGQTDCSGTCVDRSTNAMNCGACGNVCDPGFVCLMGGCTDAPPIRYRQETPTPGTVTFVDACTAPGHIELLPTTDDQSRAVTLPFAFRYWATDLAVGASVNVCSNGYINLDGMPIVTLGGVVPQVGAPDAVIAALWDDDYTRTPGICVATVGTAPSRRWVVEWQDAQYFADATPHLTFEIILTEGSNTIDLVYGTMMGVRPGTVGIENQTGATGINACPAGTGECAPATGTIIRYVPIP